MSRWKTLLAATRYALCSLLLTVGSLHSMEQQLGHPHVPPMPPHMQQQLVHPHSPSSQHMMMPQQGGMPLPPYMMSQQQPRHWLEQLF